MRTGNTSFQPVSMTPPSLNMTCSGIDAYGGSFAIISGSELVTLAKNIGKEAKSYAFQLGLKMVSPQIENLLEDLRTLAMTLNQAAASRCELTKSLFAAALPKDSTMREDVCKDMLLASQSGYDYFSAGKSCRNDLAQKEAIQKAQSKDKDLLLDNYNVFVKAAEKIGIPEDMRAGIMSMTGTIVARDGQINFYDSLAKDHKSWVSHLKGGEGASLYTCDNNTSCLNVSVRNKVSISIDNSYLGKTKVRLNELKTKFNNNTDFSSSDIAFLSSVGDAFPLYDYLSLEAISGSSILESAAELVATYNIVTYLKEVTSEIRKAVSQIKSRQVNDQHLVEYLKALDRVLYFASEKQQELMTVSDKVATRAIRIEQHLIARERS